MNAVPEDDVSLILVMSHPRSGTHFTINSLCANHPNTTFPLLDQRYAALERLLVWDHGRAEVEIWRRAIEAATAGKTMVVKTHLTPAECAALASQGSLDPGAKALVDTILAQARKLVVYRDGRDVLVSWYHYIRDGGGGLPLGSVEGVRGASFGEFIRMPNRLIPAGRAFGPQDRNRVAYWAWHVSSCLDDPGAVAVSYEDLHRSFESTLTRVSERLGLKSFTNDLNRPQLESTTPTKWRRVIGRASRRLPLGRRVRDAASIPPAARPRKGIVGGWSSYFSDEDLEFFLEHAAETVKRLEYPDGLAR